MNQTHSTLPDAASSIGRAVEQTGRDLSNGLHNAADTASGEIANVGQAARDWWLQHKDDALHAVRSAKDQARAVGDRSQEYVRAQPVKSVLVAAALGALVAAVWFGTSSRHR